MKKREDVLGKIVKVESQPQMLGEDAVLICPICEQSEHVVQNEWNMTDGEMEAVCECKECNIAFSVWFSLNYAEHSAIYDLDGN